MGLKAIVFDFNGVFVQPKEPGILESLRQKTGTGKWIALSNYYINLIKFEEGALSPRGFWNRVFPCLGDEDYQEHVEAEYEKPFGRDEQMYALAEKLSGKLPLYCLSNSNFLQGKACRKQKLYSPFREFFLSHEIHNAKPFPGAFRSMLQHTKLRAGECIFVDDSFKNVAAARLLGFRAIRFRGALQLEKKLRQMRVL